MSFLPSIRASTRLSGARASSILPRATTSAFHTSVPRRGLKEDDDRGRDELKDHYEEEKQSQLKRQKEGKGKWNQNLASSSEASVKADRGEVDSHESFVDLQDKTKNEPNKKA
ncbi:uncharacterized protein DSM5745_05497 [Aspergillus mulundensis]|uniref:Uncharacterized protein n=1 Tax=Aspergillus mulundensis TaxID=1810919 RepID=A0A3D8RX94_9EURO|nr:Uncharacterized protein DSM5745_05497 [Aspergillus mulundensis]RDW78645.1 Uncharacterized protein DSM5745_05497 [Aspergillus mulundensis]